MSLDSILDIAAAAGALETGFVPPHARPETIAVAGRQVNGARPAPNRRYWTQEELAFLRDNLGRMSQQEIADRLGRSLNAVKVKWTRMGYDAASKRKGEWTAQQVARRLGVDVKSILKLIRRGHLPGRQLPMEATIFVVETQALKRWLIRPENWIYIHNVVQDTSRIRDRKLRRLVELKKARWGDEWWRPGDVADYHGVTIGGVNQAINRYNMPAVKYGNWWIRRSDAEAYTIYPGKGNNQTIDWNEEADAFILMARAVGCSGTTIGRLVKWPSQRVYFRLGKLHDNGIVRKTLDRHGFQDVEYDLATGRVFADWRRHTDRLPGLTRAVTRFVNAAKLTRIDQFYIQGVLWTWADYHLGGVGEGAPAGAEKLINSLRYMWQYPHLLPGWYAELKSYGVDPFGGNDEQRSG